MQLLPNKLYLAINAALFIAYNGNEERPVAGVDIVEYFDLSRRALEPVLQTLSAAKIVTSMKGARGGYFMLRPQDMTVGDVMRAFVTSASPRKFADNAYNALLDKKLQSTYQDWLSDLSQITFQTLCDQARASDIPRAETPVLNFAI